MKILPILLINAVVVGGALVIYDQMRSDTPSTTYEAGGVDSVELADLASRVERLEGLGREPALRSSGDENLLRRVEALEQRKAGTTGGMARVEGASEEEAASSAAAGSPITVVGEDGPSSDEVSRFRKLMDAANDQRREEREREQLASVLERLEITMDDKQTTQYLAARRGRQEQMRTIFRSLRGNGNGNGGGEVDREAMMQKINEGRAKVNEDFAVVINKFLPSGDAAKLAEHEGQNRWGGMTRTARSGRGR